MNGGKSEPWGIEVKETLKNVEEQIDDFLAASTYEEQTETNKDHKDPPAWCCTIRNSSIVLRKSTLKVKEIFIAQQ